MSLIFYPFAISTVSYFMLGAWVLFAHKDKPQRLYGILCLTTFLWQTVWALLFAKIDPDWVMFCVRLCYTGIVFVPAVMYQFIAEFTDRSAAERVWIRTTYLSSCILAIIVWDKSLFVSGLNVYSWGLAAKRGLLHPIFVIMVAVVIGRIWMLLRNQLRESELSALKKRQIGWVRIATFVYCGGSLDLLSNYGIALFPMSPIFLGAAFVVYSYAMLRYEFLAIAPSRESESERLRRESASLEMRHMNMSAAFPLVSQGELLGYLLLGEKMSEESYSKEDLLLLRIVANQAALGYQRVRYLEMAVHGARTEMLGEIAGWVCA